MLDFGKAFNYWNDTTHLTAEGARFAAVNRKPDPANPLSLQQPDPQDQADTAELRTGGTDSVAAPAQVCVDFPNGTSAVGDPVRVTMTFTYHWLPVPRHHRSTISTDTTITSSARCGSRRRPRTIRPDA